MCLCGFPYPQSESELAIADGPAAPPQRHSCLSNNKKFWGSQTSAVSRSSSRSPQGVPEIFRIRPLDPVHGDPDGKLIQLCGRTAAGSALRTTRNSSEHAHSALSVKMIFCFISRSYAARAGCTSQAHPSINGCTQAAIKTAKQQKTARNDGRTQGQQRRLMSSISDLIA